MTAVHSPATEADACAIVADAAARRLPLALQGNGTKAGLGRPLQVQATLSSAALTGITLYEPAEMVIAARAGTPLSEVEEALAAKGQMLPFEPIDYRPLFGSGGEPTIGAVAAMNLSGPRRVMVGAARDHLIGVRFVNGRGEAIKSGGRVMKNVTGLDLVKLMAGSHGTLGFLTEVTFKVLPKPETQSTLVLTGLSDADAIAALSAALGSPFEVSGAAHLPAGIGGDGARTLLRIENFASSVTYRIDALRKRLGVAGDLLDEAASTEIWRQIRDAAFLAGERGRAVWRVSVAPSKAAALADAIRAASAASIFYDWGGGLVWIALDASGDAGAALIRGAASAAGGHATLVRAPEPVRAALDIFQPLAAPVMKLQQGIKASIDPAGIFSPGRMYAGI